MSQENCQPHSVIIWGDDTVLCTSLSKFALKIVIKAGVNSRSFTNMPCVWQKDLFQKTSGFIFKKEYFLTSAGCRYAVS